MAPRTFASFVFALLTAASVFAQGTQQQQQAPPPVPPAASGTAPQAPAAPAPPDEKAYEVGPGDRLNIVVYGEDALPKEFEVGADGRITYPFVGEIRVAGMSLRAIEGDLRARLVSGGYLTSPQVVATVLAYRSQRVTVIGQVGNAGEISLQGDEMTLSKALAKAQPTALAGSWVEIRRPKPGQTGATGPETYDMQKVQRADLDTLRVDPALRDGDYVFVPKAPQFFLSGYVKQTGAQVWTPGMTVGRAIAAAGGITEQGTLSGLKIKRLINGKYEEVKADENTLVLEGDQIEVRRRRF